QHGRDLVAVEAVEDAAGLLRVDEVLVEVARVLQRPLDRLARDLVEDHALDRHLRLERLEEVPRDGLALAVLIGREVELVGVLERALELRDLLLLVGVDLVVRVEAVVDVDRELPVRALLHVRGQLGRLRQVADVADARLDLVVVAEVALDLASLGGRLDDHELAWHPILLSSVSTCGWRGVPPDGVRRRRGRVRRLWATLRSSPWQPTTLLPSRQPHPTPERPVRPGGRWPGGRGAGRRTPRPSPRGPRRRPPRTR